MTGRIIGYGAAAMACMAAAVPSAGAQEVVSADKGGWKWELDAGGTAERLIVGTDTIPFLTRGKFRGPAFYLVDPQNGVDSTAAWVRFGAGRYVSDPVEGLVCTVEYRTDTEDPTLKVSLRNEGPVAVQPQKAGLRLGLDTYMDRWPEWFGKYFPTLMRAEKTHFWGYFQAPGLGRPLVGIACAQPVASWSADFSKGYQDPAPHWFWGHRIESVNLDLLNALPLPDRHPQNLWKIGPGETKEWEIVLFTADQSQADPFELGVCDRAQAPVLKLQRTAYRPDEKVRIELFSPSTTERPKVTLRSPEGQEIAVYARYMGGGRFMTDPFWMPKPGLYTVRAEVGGRCAEGVISALHPWGWYMDRAREGALKHHQKATSHIESWMGFYSAFIAAAVQPNDSLDAPLAQRFELLFDLLHDTVRMEPRYYGSRIQNTAGTIGMLADKYRAYGEVRDLERAARLADWMIQTSQREDGAYYNHGTIYTSVIYIAKSMMELVEEEIRLAATSPDSIVWQDRYERHYASAKRAVDQLVSVRGNFQTEGEHTFEDGMVSCSALQMGMMALWQEDPAERKRYTDAMLEVLNSHDCLTQLRVPDARRRGGTMRFWEAQYDVQMLPNMFNSPHGWSAWRGYATYYAYLLTGDERWLRETFDALGAMANLVDPQTGELSWAFISDAYVPTEQASGPDTTVTFDTPTFGNPHPRLYPTRRRVVGEEYIPMVSGWQTVNTQDNDVHEVFKLMGEAVLRNAFVVARPDGSVQGYNCAVTKRGKAQLIVVPTEPQIAAVHCNIPYEMEVTVEFGGDKLVTRHVKPMQWITDRMPSEKKIR